MPVIPDSTALTWPNVLTSLLSGADLSREATTWAMGQIMEGIATPAQQAAFLVALRAKGIAPTEMTALADEMLEHAVRIEVSAPSLDIVGTGGDRAQTVNISSTAAIVCAGAGMRIVKHGNRAASSKSGSADVIEALGVDLNVEADQVARVAEEAGITFCFAQRFHPSLRHAAQARRDLGIATPLNFLGPVTNPASPTYAAVGCADLTMAPVLAGVFAQRGKDAAVFRGGDGLDEVTISTTTDVWWVRDGQITEWVLDPQKVGVDYNPVESLRGGDAQFNAQVLRDTLAGAKGPVRDAVVLNAGIALALGDQGAGTDEQAMHEALRRGMDRAEDSIDSGAASAVIDRWVAATR